VLGIVGIVVPFLGIILGILAIIFGILALGRKAGKGMAVAGIILGALATLVGPVILVAITMPAIIMGRSLTHQPACMSSLSACGKAMVMYSALSSDQYPFPLIKQYETVANSNAAPTAGNSINVAFEADPQGWSKMGGNSMQNVWLLMKENLIGVDAFRCPEDRGWQRRRAADRYGWTSLNEFSYGVAWPYDGENAEKPNPAKLSDPNLHPSMVIMADRNPGGPVGQFPPSNHPTVGTSYLRKDSSVSFFKGTTSSLAGITDPAAGKTDDI